MSYKDFKNQTEASIKTLDERVDNPSAAMEYLKRFGFSRAKIKEWLKATDEHKYKGSQKEWNERTKNWMDYKEDLPGDASNILLNKLKKYIEYVDGDYLSEKRSKKSKYDSIGGKRFLKEIETAKQWIDSEECSDLTGGGKSRNDIYREGFYKTEEMLNPQKFNPFTFK